MTERPYIWHVSKFGHKSNANPWTVTLGRPKHCDDFKTAHSAATLEDAMSLALTLVPQEVS